MKSFLLILFLSLSTLALASGCSSKKPAVVESTPAAYQPTPETPSPERLASVAAPNLPEVEQAVKRVFKDIAVVHPDYKSSFLAGDFNGDLSQDLAVVLKPVPEKLADMNEEYPPWLLRDPRVPNNPREPLRVEKDEALLAVIHGYGNKDWRDPEATQTFLLKNVVGSSMRVQNGTEFVKDFRLRKKPRPQGDLIAETLKGSEGYLYFNAATYSWYDPKTFKGETEAPGAFHGRPRGGNANAQQ
ncbi:MAG TPA: hypothetical protein VJP89_13495 [Pyrinomonadaceae bacterium]|nr:hypothetical protein [Pyrinomonadaceae bacterium]